MEFSLRVLLSRGLAGIAAIGIPMAAVAALSHAPDPLFHDSYEGIAAGPTTDTDASRFLAQATFGPIDSDITHLRRSAQLGSEQFAAVRPPHGLLIGWARWRGIGKNNR